MSKTKECFAYNTKIIETPTTKEVYIYEFPFFIHSNENADLTDTSNRKKKEGLTEVKPSSYSYKIFSKYVCDILTNC